MSKLTKTVKRENYSSPINQRCIWFEWFNYFNHVTLSILKNRDNNQAYITLTVQIDKGRTKPRLSITADRFSVPHNLWRTAISELFITIYNLQIPQVNQILKEINDGKIIKN